MKKGRKIMLALGIGFAGLVVFVIGAFALMGHLSRSGEAPGLSMGQLAPCPRKPNCVSSENPDDQAHFTAPLTLADGNPENTLTALRQIISGMGGRVADVQDNYLAATFQSKIFGFVDDLELRIDRGNGVVHLRSASRAGYSDRGVNRARVERLRTRYTKS